jgi:hypothetical protein
MSVTVKNEANSVLYIKFTVYIICPILTRYGMPSIKEAYHEKSCQWESQWCGQTGGHEEVNMRISRLGKIAENDTKCNSRMRSCADEKGIVSSM